MRGTLQLIYDEQAQLANSNKDNSHLSRSDHRELYVEDTIYPNTDIELINALSPQGEAENNRIIITSESIV